MHCFCGFIYKSLAHIFVHLEAVAFHFFSCGDAAHASILSVLTKYAASVVPTNNDRSSAYFHMGYSSRLKRDYFLQSRLVKREPVH